VGTETTLVINQYSFPAKTGFVFFQYFKDLRFRPFFSGISIKRKSEEKKVKCRLLRNLTASVS
jgi:hypothetical protein